VADAGESGRPRMPPSWPSGGHALRQAREDRGRRSPGLVSELSKFPATSWNICTLAGPRGFAVRLRRRPSSRPELDAEERRLVPGFDTEDATGPGGEYATVPNPL
jgi:hypothetical protein